MKSIDRRGSDAGSRVEHVQRRPSIDEAEKERWEDLARSGCIWDACLRPYADCDAILTAI